MKKRLMCAAAALTLTAMAACGVEQTEVTAADPTPTAAAETPYMLPEISPATEGDVYVAVNQTSPSFTQAIVTSADIRLTPAQEAEPLERRLDGTLCTVMAACHTTEIYDMAGDARTEESDWLLVSFPISDPPQSSMGWVPLADCTAYTEETRAQIKGPFYPAEGTQTYSENGEPNESWQLNDSQSFYLDGEPNELGLVHVSGVYGGWDAWLRTGDIVYPQVGLSYFDTWNIEG